jgi:purine-nucleoside phosphorylase
MDNTDYKSRVEECLIFLQEKLPETPRTIIQLGTGLGQLAESVKKEVVLPYSDIPHFPRATVSSHSGNLIYGYIGDHKVVVLQGRFHYYEGYSTKEVAFPVRVLSLLGAENLIITNAAGGLNPLYHPGSIMIIRDHLNFLGENPLRGANVDSWGPRFPDLSEPYHPRLIKTALTCANQCGLKNVITGVYVCVPGPSLETPAETRFLRQAGADAVGMSSIPEVLVALHGGLKVLGLSVVSNVNDPDNFQIITLEDIIAAASKTEPQLKKLVTEILSHL